METYMEVGRSRFTSIEISMEGGGSIFSSIAISGSFHRNAWKFLLSVEVEASIASISCSFHECIPWKLSWPSIYPYTPTYFKLRPRAPQTFGCFHETFIRVHRHAFDLLRNSMEVSTNLHESQFISMEAFVEVGGSRFTCMEITVEVGRSQFTCMEVSGSFNVSTCKFLCRWKWKLPLLPSMAASTNIFRGSFHELPYTPIYFYLPSRVHKLPAASTRLP